MMDGRIWSVGVAVLAVLGAARADWRSPTGPDGVTRIIVEAEDMRGINPRAFGGTGPDWRVGRAGIDHYQCNVFGGHWQSRTRTAMTDAGGNRAVLSAPITVPSNGTYRLWVKYECPPHYNYAFDVVLQRRGLFGREVFRKTFGLESAVKHYSFTSGPTTGSLYWAWGIDHDAAEGYPVELQAGRYELRYEKTANPEPAGMRSIDVAMLTSELSPVSAPRFPRYPLLDELRRANHVFLRFRVDESAPGPVQVTWNRWGKRYGDFYAPIYTELVRGYGADGRMLATNDAALGQRGQLASPLAPGETSIWLDVGPCLNVGNTATFLCTAAAVNPANGRPLPTQTESIGFTVEVALAPSDKAVVKRFAAGPGESGRALSFLLQPDLRSADGLAWSRPLADVYREVARELDQEPRRATGLPRRMRFFGNTGSIFGRDGEPDWARTLMLEFRHAVGLNTMPGSALSLTTGDYARVRAFYRARGDELTRSATHHHNQDTAMVAGKLLEQGTADEFHYLSYGDEIGLPRVDVSDPAVIEAFRAYLKERGVGPESLGLAGWDRVKPLNSLSADVAVQIGVIPAVDAADGVMQSLKRLYWHSMQFRTQWGIADFAEKTRVLREKLGAAVHTSANLGGMHPFYWVHQSSFIEAFKHGAMTLAWTEDYDYGMPEASRLVAEYLAGYLKCGTKYRGQRMMFYCMPHYPGQSPEHLLQNAVLQWGQNVKDLDWFSIPPDGFVTENYVNARGGLPMFKMLRRVSDMAALTEDWLEPAKPVDAAVALLLSEASDVWEIGGKSQNAVRPGSEETHAFQEERKHTYYVLRNAGHRVDLITEADAREGWLARYKALYIGGENMERATARAIAAWVEAGGVLAGSAGAARKDEYDEPLDLLDAALGRGERRAYDRHRGPLRAKIELPLLAPMDTVAAADGDGARFPVLATREYFEAATNAAILARFRDGSPAHVRVEFGKGRGYYIGAKPATAWVKPALPAMPCGKGGPETAADGSPRYPAFEPVAFDAAAGAAVLRPLVEAGIRPDVRADAPHVVCNRLTGPKGTVLTVVNLGMQQKGPAGPVILEADGLERVGRVWSYAFPDGLKVESGDGVARITLPRLELADVVVIEK